MVCPGCQALVDLGVDHLQGSQQTVVAYKPAAWGRSAVPFGTREAMLTATKMSVLLFLRKLCSALTRLSELWAHGSYLFALPLQSLWLTLVLLHVSLHHVVCPLHLGTVTDYLFSGNHLVIRWPHNTWKIIKPTLKIDQDIPCIIRSPGEQERWAIRTRGHKVIGRFDSDLQQPTSKRVQAQQDIWCVFSL